MIIGIVGFIGSGKGSVGDILVGKGYSKDSFAKSLKAAVSIIFGWSLELLEGDTKESREWRDMVDPHWSRIMGRDITPRMILQEFGTDVCHSFISPLVWVESLFKRVAGDTVITDARFSHEIKAIRERGGKLVRVMRETDPWWVSILENLTGDDRTYFMGQFDIHRSEWDWVGESFDYTIQNDGTLEELKDRVNEMLKIIGG